MADYATLLRDHTTLTCRSVDRVFLQAYVPTLQSPGLVARFLLQRGYPIPSSAALDEIGEKYVAEVQRWAKAEGVPVRYFKKGEKKEAIAEPLLEPAAKKGGQGRVEAVAGTPARSGRPDVRALEAGGGGRGPPRGAWRLAGGR